MSRRRVLPLLAALLTLTIVSCGARQPAPPTATAAPSPTLVVTFSPAPPLNFAVEDLSLMPLEGDSGWTAIGLLCNTSGLPLSDLTVMVELTGPEGVLGQQEVELPLTHLAPGEVTPFTASFRVAGPADGVAVSATAYQPGAFERVQVTVRGMRAVSDRRGGQYILGWIENKSNVPADVAGLVVVVKGASGEAFGLGTRTAGLTHLTSGQSAPFLAYVEGTGDAVELEAYVDALQASPTAPPPLSLSPSPALRHDAQDDPFWVGVVRNDDVVPRRISAVAGWTLDGELIGAADLSFPVPVGPGESQAYALAAVPGIEAWMQEQAGKPQDLSLQIWFDAVASAPSVLASSTLNLEIRSAEAIAGTLFLQGTVRNSWVEEIDHPSVLAAVRSTEGDLLTAGWLEVALSLTPNGSADFVLALPLPEGADLAMTEYDLRALGVPVGR